MTKRNAKKIVFNRVFNRKFEADFSGGEITSDAGGALLREADRQLDLTRRMAEVFSDSREKEKVKHDALEMIRQRVFAIALGYEDLNDHDHLRHDPLFRMLAGKDAALASSPTLCRFENAVTRAILWCIAQELVETFIASFKSAPRELVLDFDATDDLIHGQQEGRFFHGYYDNYCFLPLYVFCGERLLAAYLRPSNIDGAKHAWALLALLVRRLRTEWPDIRIVFRGDAGFARWPMLRWCERHGVDYIVGLAKNGRLNEIAADIHAKAERRFNETGEKQRVFGEIFYAAGTWDRKRRVIVKAEHDKRGANPRYVVTSLVGDPGYLYEEIYCARGEMENRIKEQQLHLFADRTSAHEFDVNQLRVLLSAAAYVLMEHIRRVGLAGTELARAQCQTIRLKLLKIGAVVVRNTRRIVLHMASGYPFAGVFEQTVRRLMKTPVFAPT